MIDATGRIKGVRFGSDGAMAQLFRIVLIVLPLLVALAGPGESQTAATASGIAGTALTSGSSGAVGLAGDRGDDASPGNNIDDERRDIDDDIRNEWRNIDLVGHIGEIHCGGERRWVGSGAITWNSLRQCAPLGDVSAIWGFGNGTVPRRHQSFLRALIEARDHP